MSIGLYIVLAPLYLKSVRKLQEKRFVFVKILAIIIPENGAKVSKIKCFQFAQQTLIKQLLSESQKPWNMTQSPLYYRYEDTAQGKAFSGIGKNFVRELYSEIENKKEYEFLRGNKELESIFEEHLK